MIKDEHACMPSADHVYYVDDFNWYGIR